MATLQTAIGIVTAHAARNPIARVVKLAENAENMDLSRIPQSTDRDPARMQEFEAVRGLLLEAGKV
jgi:hypothetical protein